MSDVSQKEYLDIRFKSLEIILETKLTAVIEKIDSNEAQNAKRRHETMAEVTKIKGMYDILETRLDTVEKIVESMLLVKKIVYGLVAIVLTTVAAGVISLVIL